MNALSKKIALTALALSTAFAAAAQDTAPVPATPPAADAAVTALPPLPADAKEARQLLHRLRAQSQGVSAPAVRIDAATTIARLGVAFPELHEAAYMALARVVSHDKDATVRAAAATGFGELAGVGRRTVSGAASEAMLRVLILDKGAPVELRESAAEAMGTAGSRSIDQARYVADHLIYVLNDSAPVVRAAAVDALGRIAEAHDSYAYDVVNKIGLLMNDHDAAVSTTAKTNARTLCTANPELNCPPIP